MRSRSAFLVVNLNDLPVDAFPDVPDPGRLPGDFARNVIRCGDPPVTDPVRIRPDRVPAYELKAMRRRNDQCAHAAPSTRSARHAGDQGRREKLKATHAHDLVRLICVARIDVLGKHPVLLQQTVAAQAGHEIAARSEPRTYAMDGL